MLVLSRKTGDEIVIDRDIRIAVLATSGRTVRLGVIAPPTVRVLRREIHDRLATEGADAVSVAIDKDAANDSTIMSGVIRVAQ